jgi:hypothetical protein
MSKHDIVKSVLSGASLVGIEKVVLNREGGLLSKSSLKKAGTQAILSFAMERVPLGGIVPFTLPSDGPEAVLTGIEYTLLSYLMKVDQAFAFKRFLLSTGADFVARKGNSYIAPIFGA